MQTFLLGDYLIAYADDIKTEKFACDWYYGIIFTIDGHKHQLLHNYHMGSRLITNPKDGGCTDIPFNEKTFWLLPKGISVKVKANDR